jgi:hypothetical protein
MHFTKTARTALSLMVAFLATTSVYAETIYGTNTITIETNEAIIINFFGPYTELYIDGKYIDSDMFFGCVNPRLAIAGHHTLTIGNTSGEPTDALLTVQLLKSSVIKTLMLPIGGQTNSIVVPEGRTIQFYDLPSADIYIQPAGSANSYALYGSSRLSESGYTHPSATGPAVITISYTGRDSAGFVSYYFVTTPKVEAPTDLIY